MLALSVMMCGCAAPCPLRSALFERQRVVQARNFTTTNRRPKFSHTKKHRTYVRNQRRLRKQEPPLVSRCYMRAASRRLRHQFLQARAAPHSHRNAAVLRHETEGGPRNASPNSALASSIPLCAVAFHGVPFFSAFSAAPRWLDQPRGIRPRPNPGEPLSKSTRACSRAWAWSVEWRWRPSGTPACNTRSRSRFPGSQPPFHRLRETAGHLAGRRSGRISCTRYTYRGQ